MQRRVVEVAADRWGSSYSDDSPGAVRLPRFTHSLVSGFRRISPRLSPEEKEEEAAVTAGIGFIANVAVSLLGERVDDENKHFSGGPDSR